MPLVSKMIRYPNELEAMGLATNGKTNAQGNTTPSQESIKNSIVDIINFFKDDLNMPIVPTSGELDENNILDIPNIATYATQYNVLDEWTKYYYGFKVFAFNDDIQDTKPLFIKLNFGLVNLAKKRAYLNFKIRFSFFIDMDIIYNSSVIHSITLCNLMYTRNNDQDPTNNYVQDIINSVGIRNKSSIYVNIYPRKFTLYNDFRGYENTGVRSPYFSFYLERNEDYVKFMPLCLPLLDSVGLNYSNLSTNFTYIPYSANNKYSTNNNCIIPFVNDKIINDGDNVAFKTVDINVLTNQIIENTNVMTTYSLKSSNGTLTDVEVDGVTNQYYVYKPEPLINLCYVYNMNISLLFKVEP